MKRLYTYLIAGITLVAFSYCNGPDSNSNANTDDTTASAQPGNTEDWMLGPQMWTFRMFSFTDAIAKTDSAGLKYIEAFWGQPLGGEMTDSFGIKMSADSRAKLKELLASKGIRIVAMGVISPGSRDEWVKAFDLAKEFGLSYITAEPKKDQWDMIDSLAGSYNIRIAIHDHPRPNPYWHPDSVLAAIKGHQHIGACADIGHWARSGLDPVECLQKLSGHIYGVHLKDIKTFDDTHAEDTVVSKGVIDFNAVFAELKKQNFKGLFSIEHESNWFNNLPDIIYTAKYFDSATANIR